MLAFCFCLVGVACSGVFAQDVLTQHNDNDRTGANLNERILNTSNVNARSFGKLFQREVDGAIYAQPLYVANVQTASGAKRNVVYVATMHNSVYAFDADDPGASAPLWKASLGPSVALQDSEITRPGGYPDMSVEIGITSTPVISVARKAIYVVTLNKVGNSYSHYLHALDLSTGKELFQGPRSLSASIRGIGMGSVGGRVSLLHPRANQRAGLLLQDDTVYIAFGAFADIRPYQGWVLAYSASTLQQAYPPFNTAPDGNQAGIWQAGQGLAADSQGNVYFMTSNGSFGHAVLDMLSLRETASGAPALANFDDRRLVVAWTGTEVDHYLNFVTSMDGRSFGDRLVLEETSVDAPALAVGNGELIVAWTDRNHRVNLSSSADLRSFGDKLVLDANSQFAPALAFGDGRLFIAWAGTDDKHSLNLMSSVDGKTFGRKVTLGEGSRSPPSLGFLNGSLYLLWRDADHNGSLCMMKSADGVHFSDKTTLQNGSDFVPALASFEAGELLLAWTGRDKANSLNLMSGAGIGQFSGREIHAEYGAASAPALVTFKDKLFIAWGGRNYPSRVNVAVVGARLSLGNSFVKLKKNLSLDDWFSPWNTDDLSSKDIDLGAGGVLLLPNTNLLVGGGKEGKMYLLDRDRLGGFCAECNEATSDTRIVQWFQATGVPNHGLPPLPTAQHSRGYHHIHGAPVFWDSPRHGALLYVWGEDDWLRAYRFNGARLDPAPVDSSAASVTTPARSMPGAMLSLSADGKRSGTGILWASHPLAGDANRQVVHGLVRALDAENLSRELWNSGQNMARDDVGTYAKFNPPTVANGKVYVPTFSNKLVVYGLLQ